MSEQETVKLCECGCGRTAPIAKRTDSRYAAVKGQPKKYINGHHGRFYRPAITRPTNKRLVEMYKKENLGCKEITDFVFEISGRRPSVATVYNWLKEALKEAGLVMRTRSRAIKIRKSKYDIKEKLSEAAKKAWAKRIETGTPIIPKENLAKGGAVSASRRSSLSKIRNETRCANPDCQKIIFKQPSQRKPSGNFCSLSCSAIITNRRRKEELERQQSPNIQSPVELDIPKSVLEILSPEKRAQLEERARNRAEKKAQEKSNP